MPPGILLAIDQGTTSTRAIAFDRGLRAVASASVPLASAHPRPGWVEQDPEAVLASVVESVARVLNEVGGPSAVAGCGLDNQGETVVAWDAETGRALAPAIVWQCRRSLPIVERLRTAGLEPAIRRRTGLPLDPYFSAGKMTWLLENDDGVARASRDGRLRLGTLDAWLTARLGTETRTDPSTASRTQLLSLETLAWDPELLGWFGVPEGSLPIIGPTIGSLGELGHRRWRGALPLVAMACDQQAALAGHGAFEPAAIKATYGTGVFVLANGGPLTFSPGVGDGRMSWSPGTAVETSIAWALPGSPPSLVFQAGLFTAGAVLDWLRDDLRLIGDIAELGPLAASVTDAAGVRVLPAFAGLGGPWWRPDARGVVAGLTAGASDGHLARAVLDGIANGVADLVEAIVEALPGRPASLRVDGGLTANDYLMQRQADLLGLEIGIASASESTALGIAGLVGMALDWLAPNDIAAANPVRRRVLPRLGDLARTEERETWRRFVEAASSL